MSCWDLFESRVISGRVEYFCKCSRQLTVQTIKTRKNPGKRFVTCSKCKVYDFLDDDLPSKYYKKLLYEMFQNKKQSKKHMDYEQVINVLAIEKSICEKELRATKSKLKLHDGLFFIMLGTFSVVCVGFGMLVVCKCLLANASCKYKMQMQALQMLACKLQAANACLQMQAANACLQMQAANACLQMQAANASCKCKLQMQAANACLQMLACKCKLQMLACKCLPANACLQMQAANACLQMQAANACLQMQAANACLQMLASYKCLLAANACKCLLANA
ncbi:hypothetical protein Tco_0678778 [Tanacetum coccineum]|uniref:Uncharacterized protein n=1 Tax=Tanacetum coccineum TaxID=301880 RepID=A0ABQ4XG69_9ASTR